MVLAVVVPEDSERLPPFLPIPKIVPRGETVELSLIYIITGFTKFIQVLALH